MMARSIWHVRWRCNGGEKMDLSMIRFDEKGLVPAIVQDVHSKQVLMQAYMNEEALRQTLQTKRATYFSRSRQALWVKGETSGNTQAVQAVAYDCDGDCILLSVIQKGVACHTGARSCFFNELLTQEEPVADAGVLHEVYAVIQDRLNNPQEGSYTNYLFEKGVDKISKKVVEEACEVIIGAKNGDTAEMCYEIADLFYHVMVLMVQQGLPLSEVYEELKDRR
jgi:phosphoribosyl-ATP pyrophosphohydrolase/phosphoribosyl-AMP cyclohydrolase